MLLFIDNTFYSLSAHWETSVTDAINLIISPVYADLQVRTDLQVKTTINMFDRQNPPIVVVPKPHNPDEIRICMDRRSVNRVIERQRHIKHTMDDIVSDLDGYTVFSKYVRLNTRLPPNTSRSRM